MGEVWFYHLTRSPVESVLPMLLEKALAAGWRIVVRGTDPARVAWLDERLWLDPEEGFLPHGLAGGAHDAAQPVLLTVGPDLPNAAACLMVLDGAEVAAEEVKRLERVCVLFDGGEEAALARARAQWRALTGAGCKARYWSEESGRWQMKAES